jgi:sorting nexin-8
MAKRNEAAAQDYSRLSNSLQGLVDISASTYAIDTNDVPLLNEGISATAKHLSASQSLIEDETRAHEQGLLEDLKSLRDGFVSMREMFDRRDRYSKDTIPYLERRIETTQNKLAVTRGKPEGLVKPGEIEKLEESIIKVWAILFYVMIEAHLTIHCRTRTLL